MCQIRNLQSAIRNRGLSLWIAILLVTLSCQGRATPAPTPTEGPSPGVTHLEIAGRRVVKREVVDPPEPAPGFHLIDRSGKPLSLEDLQGKVVVLSFIYTNCPEACPLLAANFVQLQREFAAALDQGDLALVFITMDPERDTLQRLQQYTTALGGRWFFLRGSQAELQKVWQEYGIYREVRERTRQVIIYHSYKTFLIDRKGRLRIRYLGIWYPRDVIPDVRQLLEESDS